MIRSTLYCVLFFSLSYTQVVAAETHANKTLDKKTSMAIPAHKTTRIQWTQFPKIKYTNSDLQQQERTAIIRIYADELGNVNQAEIKESTGMSRLDQTLLNAVKIAKVKPHIVNGSAIATIGFQTFNLKYMDEQQPECTFNSKVWLNQIQDEKTPFRYKSQPELSLDISELNGYDRDVRFTLKANKYGDILSVKIQKGSGIYALDQKITTALLNTKVESKRSASTLWLLKKSKLKDSIQFKLDDCNK